MLSLIISSYHHNKHVKSVLISNFDTFPKDTLKNDLSIYMSEKFNEQLSIKTIKHIRLVFKHNVDHYLLFLFLIALKESGQLCSNFVDQFSHSNLNLPKLLIKYNLNDTPIYPLSIRW